MRTIVAGGRRYRFNEADVAWLDHLRNAIPITEVVSGRCGHRDKVTGRLYGADLWGEWWAGARGIPVKPFAVPDAEWRALGPRAGPLRNQRMADYAAADDGPGGALVLFAGNAGTNSMRKIGHATGLVVYETIRRRV